MSHMREGPQGGPGKDEIGVRGRARMTAGRRQAPRLSRLQLALGIVALALPLGVPGTALAGGDEGQAPAERRAPLGGSRGG